ncbi:MAG: thymidine phosphorylase [Pyrinomonadaceae bacterium]|nr:thymidine phosphorylase [Pyrinomonadaceae bacterium]
MTYVRPQSIIAAKRDGKILNREQIDSFIEGVTDGSWADYQISALIMAMFLNELNSDEQAHITQAMLHSGEVLDFSSIEKPKSDKHSTGGVGDKTSLIIAPLVAACDVAVPMVSGRGLGHTGGTLDKLESIPGYNVNLSTDEFKRIVSECGYAMSGQTADIAPADKKIYALRDATATVPTIPLIVASIMSKKLAEGLDSLVLDVKTGNGAFMESLEDATRLAKAMVETGESCGVKTKALITDMSQPLGAYVGNALEVYECVKILRNDPLEHSEPLVQLSLELAARMLEMSGRAETVVEAMGILKSKIEDGSALDKFRLNTEMQGGDAAVCDTPEKLIDESLLVREVLAENDGFVESIDTKGVGFAICDIGGGRVKAEDDVDPAVGYASLASIGTEIREGDPIGVLYCRNESQFEAAGEALLSSYKIGNSTLKMEALIKDVVG